MRRFFLLMVLLTASCSTGLPLPDLSLLYRNEAKIQGADRQLLITVPGFLGSQLVDTSNDKILWGDGIRLIANLKSDETLQELALPFSDGDGPNHRLRDTVEAGRILQSTTARIFGLPIEVDVYSGILNTLRAGGWVPVTDMSASDLDSGQRPSIFSFSYDWRLDLEELVAQFDAFVRDQHANQRLDKTQGLDLIAHSMGTLIARYYLMYGTQKLPKDGTMPKVTWAGAKFFRNVILVAPPNAGSATAFHDLINGSPLGPLQPVFPAPLAGSIFSTYLLMPRERHKRVVFSDTGEAVPIYDPKLWQRYGWSVASPKAADFLRAAMPDVADPALRRARALRFQAEALSRAKRFHRALDRPENRLPEGLTLYMVVGGSHKTPATAEVDRETGKVTIGSHEEGDGTVLRVSSLLDERQGANSRLALATPLAYSSVLFLPEDHIGLTQSPVFGDNLLFWLLQGTRDAEFLRNARGTRATQGIGQPIEYGDAR